MRLLRIGLVLFATVFCPAFLLANMLLDGYDELSMLVVTVAIALFISYTIWAILSLHLRILWLLLLLGMLVYLRDWWSLGGALGTLLLLQLVFRVPLTREEVTLASPSAQRLYVFQGGNTWLVNHHWRHPAERYALDLVGMDTLGRRAKGIFPKDLKAYRCFGTALLSPLAGRVVRVENDHPDLRVGHMDKGHPYGNCVIIQSTAKPSVQIVLAHLMQQTVTVQPGSVVQPGDLIGSIGNSGNTSEPHLHIHAQKMENGEWKGVPLKINGHRLMRNMIVPTNEPF